MPDTVSLFREQTRMMFRPIDGLTYDEVESIVRNYVLSVVNDNEIPVEITDVIISGSRCRGLEHRDSDLDAVVEYDGSIHEDSLFNILNADGFTLCGIKLDINPICPSQTGTLSSYLPGVIRYLSEYKEDLK